MTLLQRIKSWWSPSYIPTNEIKLIKRAIAQGKGIEEVMKLMSRSHFYLHLYKGKCDCGIKTE